MGGGPYLMIYSYQSGIFLSYGTQSIDYDFPRTTHHSGRLILPVKLLCANQQDKGLELGKLLARTVGIRISYFAISRHDARHSRKLQHGRAL